MEKCECGGYMTQSCLVHGDWCPRCEGNECPDCKIDRIEDGVNDHD